MKPMSIAEVNEIIEKSEDKKQLVSFLGKFSKINIKDAKAMRKELEDLGMVKLNEANVVKVIDLLPEDASDLNKIFSETSLDEDEVHKILEVVKKYK